MPANVVVRARVDKNLKEEASVVLASIGLTVSDAFRMMLVRGVAEHYRSILWCPMRKPSPRCATPGSETCSPLTPLMP